MQSLLAKKYIVFAPFLFLMSCSGNFEKESQESLALVQKESQLFQALEKTSLELEAVPLKSTQHLRTLSLLDDQFEKYLKALFAFQKLLHKYRSFNFHQNIKSEYYKLDKKLRENWEQKFGPKIAKLLKRNADLKIYLTSWDFAELEERIEDISLLKKQNSADSSTLQYVVELPKENTEKLLELLYNSSTSHHTVQVPSLSTFSMKFTFVEDFSFKNTQQDCLDLLPSFVDKNCASDFKRFCEKKESRQLQMSCVDKVVSDYKNADCRERKTNFLSADYENEIVESTEAKRLYNSLVDCRSKEAVLN